MEGISNEVTRKIMEVLEDKQDPYNFVFKKDTKREKDYFYVENKNEIMQTIEIIICEHKKLTLLQLYNLILVYFEGNILNQIVGEYIKKLATLSKSNSKNLRLLKSILEMTDDKRAIENSIKQMSKVLDE